ncbi:hypothetical protein [Neptuniibacter sp. QD37_11]|uniref:hypothetical protein n=1 Tax=Neptuniibacter sp. QD37_11 TaxID=3398209 RepID=UPI0039F4FB28
MDNDNKSSLKHALDEGFPEFIRAILDSLHKPLSTNHAALKAKKDKLIEAGDTSAESSIFSELSSDEGSRLSLFLSILYDIKGACMPLENRDGLLKNREELIGALKVACEKKVEYSPTDHQTELERKAQVCLQLIYGTMLIENIWVMSETVDGYGWLMRAAVHDKDARHYMREIRKTLPFSAISVAETKFSH